MEFGRPGQGPIRIDPAALGLKAPENKLPVAAAGSEAPKDFVSGVARGAGVLVHHTLLGVGALLLGPALGATKDGWPGCAKGACAGLLGVSVGAAPGCFDRPST